MTNAPYNAAATEGWILTPTRDPETILQCLDEQGRLQAMPAAFYARWPRQDLCFWCVRRGYYCLPTRELVEFVRDLIDCDDALEIGSGNGCLGRSVGIPLTDSKQQERDDIQALYTNLDQATITYGADVEKLTGLEAVERYRPSVVLAAWVTHRWNRQRPKLMGNMNGVDEGRLLEKKSVKRYIFVGNEHVHRLKPILSRRHTTHRLPFLFSRSMHVKDVVWVWER